MRYPMHCWLLPVVVLFFGPSAAAAQEPYRQPPAPIAQILDAEQMPAVSVSPDRARLLLLERRSLPPIAEVAEPELRLAGQRINPRTGGPSRDISFKGLRLRGVSSHLPKNARGHRSAGEIGGSNDDRRIETPSDARISNVMWSDDAARIAFTNTADSVITVWVADAAVCPTSGCSARQITPAPLSASVGAPCNWVSSSQLACRMRETSRGKAPTPSITPSGPVIQESQGRAAPNRTYQDLLQNPTDEALFEHHFANRVALVSLDGQVTPIGEAGLHTSAVPSPDGKYLLVQTLHRPFSYVVPASRFPVRIQVWDLSGKVVRVIADRGLQEEVSIAFDAVPIGVRNISWRADAPATVVWAEALDGGDPEKNTAKRDRLYTLQAPFTGEKTPLIDLDLRAAGVTWARSDLALVEEFWWKTRRTRTWAIDPSKPTAAPRLLFDRSSEDRYADPGRFAMRVTPLGTSVLLTSRDGRSAYLMGDGASPEGDRPCIDRIDLSTAKTTRLWRSAAPYYEQPVAVLDGDGHRSITRRESVNDVPNYFLRDLKAKQLAQLTNFADPAPQFAGVRQELIRYRRGDGVDLTATLYLPAGYDKSKGALPFLFWAYPEEFKTAAAAAQVRGSPYRFTRPSGSSHLFLLTQGYGILDGPTMPIVGEGDKEPNDTYVQQLVASAKAAVDKVVEMGIGDRERIGIGGHSYGAFMAANLLAHADLFRAGIARSGAYNRTLTPFGFQAEERPFWKAREIYAAMSPFYYADQIKEPILLMHGEADNNSGTFPIQSERMFAALKGNGATVRYVVLPAESHGYRARESVGHTLWEMINWMDKYVKSAAAPRVD